MLAATITQLHNKSQLIAAGMADATYVLAMVHIDTRDGARAISALLAQQMALKRLDNYRNQWVCNEQLRRQPKSQWMLAVAYLMEDQYAKAKDAFWKCLLDFHVSLRMPSLLHSNLSKHLSYLYSSFPRAVLHTQAHKLVFFGPMFLAQQSDYGVK